MIFGHSGWQLLDPDTLRKIYLDLNFKMSMEKVYLTVAVYGTFWLHRALLLPQLERWVSREVKAIGENMGIKTTESNTIVPNIAAQSLTKRDFWGTWTPPWIVRLDHVILCESLIDIIFLFLLAVFVHFCLWKQNKATPWKGTSESLYAYKNKDDKLLRESYNTYL